MAELAQRDISRIGEAAGNILKDTEKLVRQEFNLFEAKLKQDINQKVQSLILGVVGLVFLLAALICVGSMLVNLGTSIGLPLWASYGLTAAIFMIAGAIALTIMRGKYGKQREET